MASRRVRIVNCKSASIRQTPWIPWRDKELAGIRYGSKREDDTVKMGSFIEVDTNATCYDWTGRKFYKAIRPKGWIYEGCIDLEDSG